MDSPQEYKGTKFLFAFYNWKKKSWWICNKRFILSIDGACVFGQFLQSNWFKSKWNKKYDIDFMVIQVAKNDSIEQITNKINNNDFSDIRKFNFYLSKDIYNVFLYSKLNQRKVTLTDVNGNQLILKIIKFLQNNKTDLYLTLPEILINI